MTQVPCAQFRYTWAERRLNGRGGEFGIVLRSPDWPAGLLEDRDLRDVLTNLAESLRSESPETAVAAVSHLRVRDGSLLVAKRPVGTDGAGRPGNYAVHALFDPTGTLGALDLDRLVRGGVFVLEREVDITPDDQAPPVRVWAGPDWRGTPGPRPVMGQSGPPTRRFGTEPLRYGRPEEAAELLAGLCRRLPADLVNQVQLDGPRETDGPTRTAPGPVGDVDSLIAECRSAVELGAVDDDLWWQRRGLSVSGWRAELRGYVAMNQPITQVPDDVLWMRWDRGTARAKALVAREILARPALVDQAAAAAELQDRPLLLNELMEAGLRGRGTARASAARWAAVVGSDDQVVDLAVELQHLDPGGTLPAPLVDRLQRLLPERLPGPLATTLATSLDGSGPMAPAWRQRCLRLLVSGAPTCARPEMLVGDATEEELTAALGAVVAEGVEPKTGWENLAVAGPVRRARVFAAAGVPMAHFVLTQEVGTDDLASAGALWSLAGRTLGWAEWSRTLPGRLNRELRRLRVQRTVLLALVGVLVIVAVVLAII